MATLVFVDVEAPMGVGSPAVGDMTEFGAVVLPPDAKVEESQSWASFHGTGCSQETFDRFRAWLDAQRTPAWGRLQFVTDNPAFDWQWINFYFWKHHGKMDEPNPFGFSARRIGDFYAGLVGNWKDANRWKYLRITKHDHNPVNDARGNAEAFVRLLKGER